MFEPHFSENFKKRYKKLPKEVQIKFRKQLKFLISDYRHPSLHAQKKSGEDLYEARVDYHYRFLYSVAESEIWFLTIGPHDEGLGKK